MYYVVYVMDFFEVVSVNLIVVFDIFESYIKCFKKEGYYFLVFNEVYCVLNENVLFDKKVIWIIFDDGNVDFYIKVYFIFKKYKVKVINNIIIGFV